MLNHRLANIQVRHLLKGFFHHLGVAALIGLGAQRLYGWPFALVQRADLNKAGVGYPTHEPAQRVDLAHQVALGWPADARVARHMGQLIKING